MVLNFIKNYALPAVFARLPFGLLQRVTAMTPLIPYYHGVSDEPVPHVDQIYQFKTVKQFEDDLETFLKFYQPIGLKELLSGLNNGNAIPQNSFLLTFDDGFREVHEIIAPLLLKKGVTATFFLISACLDNKEVAYSNKASLLLEHLKTTGEERRHKELLEILADYGITNPNLKTALLSVDYARREVLDVIAGVLGYDFSSYLRKCRPHLTTEQVRKLIEMGFTIGAHSIDHPQYSRIPLSEQLHQTHTSNRLVRERFGLDYGAFAFPNGDDTLSNEFFDGIFQDGGVDVSFGNAGALKRIPRRHFPRLPMEKETASGDKVIGRFYAKAIYDITLRRRIADRSKIPGYSGVKFTSNLA
jgi:peptidoglycan/xylan/chitin deacetylase (PgdA/CDA1 family)